MTRALQRVVHMGCKQLGLDDEDRRALQLRVTGKASMTEMTVADLTAVLRELKKDGFDPQPKGKTRHAPAPRKDLKLVHVLWKKLGDAGSLKSPGRAGLNAFVRTRFGPKWGSVPADIDMLRDADKIEAVIQALKQWGKRDGIAFDWTKARP